MAAPHGPTGATSALTAKYPQLHVMPRTAQLRGLMTIIRNKDTERSDFVFYSDRLIRLLVEEGVTVCRVTAPDAYLSCVRR